MKSLATLGALLLGLTGCVRPRANPVPPPAAFETFRDTFLDWYLREAPILATQLGIHEYDAAFPDLSAAHVAVRIQDQHRLLADLERVERAQLTLDEQLDLRLIEYALRAGLLEDEEVRTWQTQPSFYIEGVAYGLDTLLERDHAPFETRVRSLLARLEATGAAMAAAKANLRDVPEVLARKGIEDARGTSEYLVSTLPAVLHAQGFSSLPQDLRDAVERERKDALAALQDLTQWLEHELLPRAHSEPSLGSARLALLLLYEEHLEISLDELERTCERLLANTQQELRREAALLEPARSVEQVLAELGAPHPASDQLVDATRSHLASLERFVRERDLLTLPSQGLPRVLEAPPYNPRAFASMAVPGPFETHRSESYLYVTNVAEEWSAQEKDQYLAYFSDAVLPGIVAHEAIPGHFVQLSHEERLPTSVRKVLVPLSYSEGWAHYAEQMIIDEGFAADAPRVRLGHLRNVLVRLARWYATLAVHVHGTSLDVVTRRFMELTHLEEFTARREVERAVYDPTYLYYAVGKLQITELREAYRAHQQRKGRAFSLKDFHDRFLALGLPPAVARRALLSE